ncbi:MAG: ATP-binding protein [Byssovorax sp.]
MSHELESPPPPPASSTTEDSDYVRAILNILEDFSAEKARLADTQKAVLNILEDFSAEKTRLESTQKAILNILEDFDAEKSKVEEANVELRREVAERRVAELALMQKTVELARSNAELEQFAYVASHDLQEPLRMVSSYVQLFEKRYRGQVDEQADKYIHYAVEGARRMQLLIGGLLEYSRMGRPDVEPSEVSAEVPLEQALSNLRSTLEEAAVEVTHDPMPQVIADPAQLTQVFQNLIGNAIKFRRRDVPAKIHVAVDTEKSPYIFSVRDNGIGIAPEYAERIFVIFQRLHTRAEYPGTGIGLSICKKVLERHGGRIWVESTLGAGATFHFTLPAPRSPS